MIYQELNQMLHGGLCNETIAEQELAAAERAAETIRDYSSRIADACDTLTEVSRILAAAGLCESSGTHAGIAKAAAKRIAALEAALLDTYSHLRVTGRYAYISDATALLIAGLEYAQAESKAVAGPLPITEKDRRIYYQDIVYRVCSLLEHHESLTPPIPLVCCGTVERPTTMVQDRVREILEELGGLRSAVNGWKNQVSEWKKNFRGVNDELKTIKAVAGPKWPHPTKSAQHVRDVDNVSYFAEWIDGELCSDYMGIDPEDGNPHGGADMYSVNYAGRSLPMPMRVRSREFAREWAKTNPCPTMGDLKSIANDEFGIPEANDEFGISETPQQTRDRIGMKLMLPHLEDLIAEPAPAALKAERPARQNMICLMRNHESWKKNFRDVNDELKAQLAACQAELARERELLSMLHNVAGDYAFEQAEAELELSKRAKE